MLGTRIPILTLFGVERPQFILDPTDPTRRTSGAAAHRKDKNPLVLLPDIQLAAVKETRGPSVVSSRRNRCHSAARVDFYRCDVRARHWRAVWGL